MLDVDKAFLPSLRDLQVGGNIARREVVDGAGPADGAWERFIPSTSRCTKRSSTEDLILQQALLGVQWEPPGKRHPTSGLTVP